MTTKDWPKDDWFSGMDPIDPVDQMRWQRDAEREKREELEKTLASVGVRVEWRKSHDEEGRAGEFPLVVNDAAFAAEEKLRSLSDELRAIVGRDYDDE